MKKKWSNILHRWYRESRHKEVVKSVFPTLVKSLWDDTNPKQLLGGFLGTGIYPLDKGRAMQNVIGKKVENLNQSNQSTPSRHLTNAIISVLAPKMSEQTEGAITRSKSRKRRISSQDGVIFKDENTSSKKCSTETNEEPKEKDKREEPQNTKDNLAVNCKPIGVKSRQMTCKRLGLHPTRLPTFGNISGKAPSRLHKVQGDGNCFYRSLAFCLTGSEEDHEILRQKVANHMKGAFRSRLEAYMNKSLDLYLKENAIEKNGVWASENEILCAASLLMHDIAVYSRCGTELQWLIYPASFSLDNLSHEGVFLDNSSGFHFDVVIC